MIQVFFALRLTHVKSHHALTLLAMMILVAQPVLRAALALVTPGMKKLLVALTLRIAAQI
jgi:hypothetical protein